MTDIPALDAEIVKAAEAWFAKAPAEYRDRFHAEACAIFDAVAAKRAADKPKPLSAEEALQIYYPTEPVISELDASYIGDMTRVLDAAAERWLKVIEALPQSIEVMDGTGAWVLEALPVDAGRVKRADAWVRLSAIRSALKPGGQ